MKRLEYGLYRNIQLMYAFRLFQKLIFSLPIRIIFFAAITQNYAMAMGLFSISYISTFIFELPTGFLSDTWGRKWVCVSGAFCLLISNVLYAVAPNYVFLVLGSIFMGLSQALASGNDETLLYESMVQLGKKDDYLAVTGKVSSIGQFGLGIGAAIGGLFTLISLQTTMYVTIIPMGLSFLISLFFTEPHHLSNQSQSAFCHIKYSIKYLLKHRRLRYLFAGEAFHLGLSEAAFSFNPIFFKLFVPVWSLGIFRALGHLCGSLGAYSSAYFCKRFGINKTFLWGAFLNNGINILSVLAASVLSPILKLGSSFVNSMKDPATNTLMQHEIPNSKRATVLSIGSLMNCFIYSGSTLFIGFLADQLSPYWAMLIAYLLALASNTLFIKALTFKSIYYKKKGVHFSS